MSNFTEEAKRGLAFLAQNYGRYRLQVDYDGNDTPRINLYSVRYDTNGGEIFSFKRELDGSALFVQVQEAFSNEQ